MSKSFIVSVCYNNTLFFRIFLLLLKIISFLVQKKKKQLPSIEEFMPYLAYDFVILDFNGKQLQIIILEYHNTGFFALPGGFVKHDEHVVSAIKKAERERAGLDTIYLEQFHTFGSASRSALGCHEDHFRG
tara:strand:- start:1059 stop:1451 length:393 start_codon:yes stop_codon:yes gene_type:complete